MTIKLSQQKISRLLKYYFAGMTQPAIAQKVGTDQSTISLYAKRFSERAAEIGLLAAAKEFNVLEEVSELRSLSVELLKANLTVEDTRQGVKIIDTFQKLGIGPDQHTKLIEVCKKVDDPSFVHAALELLRIEAQAKVSYEKAIAKYDAAVSQIPSKKNELTQMQAKLDSLNGVIADKAKTLQNVDADIKQRQQEAERRKAELQQEYEARKKQLDATQLEVKQAAELKRELRRHNLDFPTLIQLVKEFSHGSAKN